LLVIPCGWHGRSLDRLPEVARICFCLEEHESGVAPRGSLAGSPGASMSAEPGFADGPVEIEYHTGVLDNGKSIAVKTRGRILTRGETCLSTGEAVKLISQWESDDESKQS
jgi:hypothetical protein